MKNDWKNGVMGVVIGDALGCPVQFESREEVAAHPVLGMRGDGTFHLPAGSWTDDSSLTLALLDSILQTGGIYLHHVMGNLIRWLDEGEFTPYGYAYDVGYGTLDGILHYKRSHNPLKCGGCSERSNGNGSLMRILPACLYCQRQHLPDAAAIDVIHRVGSLTHAHIRSNIACGLYYFMVQVVLEEEGGLLSRLQTGLDRGFAYYGQALADQENVEYYDRLRNLAAFRETPENAIKSSGYVVDTLEAAVWSLLQTDSFEDALLRAVNLGDDSDTVGAVAGGLAGLFYGFDAIPRPWLDALQRRAWIEEMCDQADAIG